MTPAAKGSNDPVVATSIFSQRDDSIKNVTPLSRISNKFNVPCTEGW